jgi:hypothetical protein
VSLQPISLTSEIEQYVNCAKNSALSTETSITWNGAGNTVRKKTPRANLGFPTAGQGTAWAEDSPTGLANENTVILTGPANNTQLIVAYAWRNFRRWILDKLVINVGFCMNASANAGNDVNFDTVQLTLQEFYPNAAPKDIIPPTGPISTGHTTLTGAGSQVFIYEEPFTPNYKLEDNSYIVLGLQMNCTGGTATRQEGILPAFPFQKTNATKWYSQSGVYLLGRGIL